MSKERAYNLIAKSISSDLGKAEVDELNDLLLLYPALKTEQSSLTNAWQLAGEVPEWQPNTELALKQLKRKIHDSEVTTRQKPSRFTGLLKIAAVGIILIGAGFLLRNALVAPSDPVEYASQSNEIEAIQMTDGSTILLNATAKVTFYPAEREMRKVALAGEAFFDVQRNPEKPFIVTTPRADIEVLGTSFNVNASEDLTKVIVRTGVVKVTNRRTGGSVTLLAGESIIVDEKPNLSKNSDQQVPFSSYEDLLQFDDQSLDKVFQRLGWTFNKAIAWDHSALKNCTLTSNLNGKDLSEVLSILKHALNLESTSIENDQIILTGGHCK